MHGALDNIFANKIQSFNRFGGGSPPVAYVTQPRGGSPPVAYVTRSITPPKREHKQREHSRTSKICY